MLQTTETSEVADLAGAADRLAGQDLDRIFDDDLAGSVFSLRRSIDGLEAEWLRRVGELGARDSFDLDGFASMASWLAARCRLGWGRARSQVALARALRSMPITAAAFATGDLDTQRVSHLVAAHKAHPGPFADHETTLVEVAVDLDPGQLWRALDHWRQALDYDAALEDANHLHEQRRLSISPTFGGMFRIDGDLDPEGGHIVMTALRAIAEPAARDGSGAATPQQRRADALVELCRDFLDHGATPIHGGEKPHITVTVDLDSLEGRAGRQCDLEESAIHPETVRRLACDAAISRVITKGESEPLDVGRRTRTVPASIRRALVVRDGGCTWEGCERPARWCDAHHLVHWADGGDTSLDNLRLLCRHHHRLVHEGEPGWHPP